MRSGLLVLAVFTAAAAGGLAWLTVGAAAGVLAAVGVVVVAVAGATGPPTTARLAAGLLTAVLVGSLGVAAWGAAQIVSALNQPPGPPATADPVALAGAESKLDAAGRTSAFRVTLSEDELTAVIQDGLADAETPLEQVTFDFRTQPPPGRVHFDAVFQGGEVSADGNLAVRVRAGAIEIELIDAGVGFFNLPPFAIAAIEDLLARTADLNQALTESGATIQSVKVEEDQLVIVGVAVGEDMLSSEALLADLRDQAAAAATAVTPPPERYGPGRINDTFAPGDVYYLALGDSLAANAGVAEPRDGYVSRFHNQLELRDGRTYGLSNLGEIGETSATLITGGQLDRATAFLRDNPVAYVTIDIGANDLLGHLGSDDCAAGLDLPSCQTRIATTFAAYRDNLEEIFGALRQAGPSATVVFLQVYNPFSLGLGTQFEDDTDAVLAEFNALAADVAVPHGILVADGFSALQHTTAATTHMLDDPADIHPLPIGYDLLTGALLDALAQAAAGGTPSGAG